MTEFVVSDHVKLLCLRAAECRIAAAGRSEARVSDFYLGEDYAYRWTARHLLSIDNPDVDTFAIQSKVDELTKAYDRPRIKPIPDYYRWDTYAVSGVCWNCQRIGQVFKAWQDGEHVMDACADCRGF